MPPPIMTYTIILINVIIFLMMYITPGILVPGASSPDDVIFALGVKPGYILSGKQLYTIFTGMFLHAGLTHIFGNMLYLFVFGDNVEAALGRKGFLALYFGSGIGAALFHAGTTGLIPFTNLLNSYSASGISPLLIPAVGASGAISGVLAAYLLLFPSSEIRMITLIGFAPVYLRMPAAVYIAIWFIFQLLYGIATLGTGVSSGIAFWAHIGGFLTGLALTPYLARHSEERYRSILRFYY